MEMNMYFSGGKKVSTPYNGFTIETGQTRNEGGDGSAPESYKAIFQPTIFFSKP